MLLDVLQLLLEGFLCEKVLQAPAPPVRYYLLQAEIKIKIKINIFQRHFPPLKINSSSIQIGLAGKEESSFRDHLHQVSEASVNHTPKATGNPLS